MTLNENIRSIRKEHRLTQEQLAEAMGVSSASVSKWETGQSAPELTMLAELADFFDVSVDALIGHTISGGRREELLAELEKLKAAKRFDEGKEVAEKLLRRYPNSYEVVEKVSDFYSDAYLFTEKRADMERAIELTQRLFALSEDPTGARRFELLSRMANHYELLKDWETTQKYYREGNVGRLNDRALARCMGNAAKDRKAAEALSEVFCASLAELLCDCLMLEQVWQELGQPERAEAAMNWGGRAIEALGGKTAKTYEPLALALYSELAFLQEKQGRAADAEKSIRAAVRIARDGGTAAADRNFLTDNRVRISVTEEREGGVDLVLMLTRNRGSAELLAAALEEVGR